MGWLKNKVLGIVQEIVPDMVKELVWDQVRNIVKLDPNSQYLLVVKTERQAQDLMECIREYFDEDRLPRIAILVSDEVGIVILTPGKDRQKTLDKNR